MFISWKGGLNCTPQEINKIPQLAGIYVITDYNGKIYYVGQANNLQRRFAEHLSDSEPNINLKKFINQYYAKFFWIEVPSKENRDSIELSIYSKEAPALNNIRPSGTIPIPVSW